MGGYVHDYQEKERIVIPFNADGNIRKYSSHLDTSCLFLYIYTELFMWKSEIGFFWIFFRSMLWQRN